MKYNFKYEDIDKIKFEGPSSNNPLAFKYYDADRKILGKTMKEWLRFSGTWWHFFESRGQDPFGETTMQRYWDANDWKKRSEEKVVQGFKLMEKMGIEFFAFHDRDLVEECDDINEYFKRVDYIVDLIEKEMKRTGIKLLWNTSNLFSHRRYHSGAGTAPEFDVYAYAAAQTKHSLDICKRLSAQGFTFWGGREGYETLLNTDMLQEEKQMASLMKMAVEYADKLGMKDLVFYIEPKAKEPMKHQYDYDCATAIGFLKKYGLDKRFKMNIEQNHAMLAGHTFQHEIHYARMNDMLGSLDSNQGDPNLGWDTDQYPYDVYNSTLAMYEIIQMGGLKTGGLNFDSKLRRSSTDFIDHVHGLIMGMDAYAKGLIAAAKLHEDKALSGFVEQRYSSWNSKTAKTVLEGKMTLEDLAAYGMEKNISMAPSGKQELLEDIVNRYILESK